MIPNPFLQYLQANYPAPPQNESSTFAYATNTDPYTAFDPLLADALPYNQADGTTDPVYKVIGTDICQLASAIQAVLAAADGINGANLIGYLPSGSLAVPRTVQTKLQDILSVKDAGALGDGITDESNAFVNALLELSQRGGGTLWVPAGSYVISQALAVPPNVTIRGDGAYSTMLLVKTAVSVFNASQTVTSLVNVAAQNPSNIEIADLSIAAQVPGVVGVTFTNLQLTALLRVGFLGCSQNFVIDRGGFHTIHDCFAKGYGTLPCGSSRLWSSNDWDYVFNVDLSNFQYIDSGTGNNLSSDPAALYMRRCVNCTISRINALRLDAGSTWQNAITIENDSQGCIISDCVFVHVYNGVTVQQGSGVAVSPSVITFNNVAIDQAANRGYLFVAGIFLTVEGGAVTPNANQVSITPNVIWSGASFVTFKGTTVNRYFGPGGCGFYFGGCSFVTIEGCNIIDCTSGFVFASNPTHIRLANNQLNGCSAPISGSFAGVGNYLSNNDGCNPLPVVTPAIPASGAVTTNNTGLRCTVYVSGGTVSSYEINGQTLTGVTGTIGLDVMPGENIIINYSSPPSWTWIGH